MGAAAPGGTGKAGHPHLREDDAWAAQVSQSSPMGWGFLFAKDRCCPAAFSLLLCISWVLGICMELVGWAL